MKSKTVFVSILFIFISIKSASANFFKNITDLIDNNYESLRYGISVADVNNDGAYEFIVAGFGSENLALSYKNNKLINIVNDTKFADKRSFTIGVAACDIDSDGYEEIYFLNTDTYSGEKKYSDRLIDLKNTKFFDLFEQKKNQIDLNFTAGRSVVCVDRNGNGKYGIYVANYGGPTRFYEKFKGKIKDRAAEFGLDKITGGRAVVAGHILSNNIDIFAANERGVNFLYKNVDGVFYDVASGYNVLDPYENGRGTALSDVLYRGQLDIVSGNWDGEHRIFIKKENSFKDIADSNFKRPSKIRTVITADFDNDGYDEIFLNNIGEPNKLFKIRENGKLEEIDITSNSETNGLGTGAAVAYIDKDGIFINKQNVDEKNLNKLTIKVFGWKEKFKKILSEIFIAIDNYELEIVKITFSSDGFLTVEEKDLKTIFLGLKPNLINYQLQIINNLKNEFKKNSFSKKIDNIDLTDPNKPKIKVFKP